MLKEGEKAAEQEMLWTGSWEPCVLIPALLITRFIFNLPEP